LIPRTGREPNNLDNAAPPQEFNMSAENQAVLAALREALSALAHIGVTVIDDAGHPSIRRGSVLDIINDRIVAAEAGGGNPNLPGEAATGDADELHEKFEAMKAHAADLENRLREAEQVIAILGGPGDPVASAARLLQDRIHAASVAHGRWLDWTACSAVPSNPTSEVGMNDVGDKIEVARDTLHQALSVVALAGGGMPHEIVQARSIAVTSAANAIFRLIDVVAFSGADLGVMLSTSVQLADQEE
jgi:hypothetical protein